MSNTLHSLVNSTIINMFLKHLNKNYIFVKNILRCDHNIFLTLGCHSKVNQRTENEKIFDFDFENVSNSYRLSHSCENDSTIQFSQKRM